jgi:hypothetical protein
MTTGRRFVAGVVTLLACVAILVTLLAHYADNLAGNSASFAGRAVSVVRTPGVESMIVSTITDRIQADTGRGAAAQPLVQEAVQEALTSPEVSDEIQAAATSLQSQLLSGTADRLTLTLPDFGSRLAPVIESRSPELAVVVRNLGTVTVVDVAIPSSDASAVHDLAELGRDATLLLVLSVALIALALLLSPDRARTLRALGAGVALCGVAAAAAYLAGRQVVVGEFSSTVARTAARAVWSTYLGGLETWGFVLAGVGIAVALLAATQVRSRRAQTLRY